MQYHICLYMPESGLFDLQVDNTNDLRSYEEGNRRRNKYAPYSTVRPAGIDLVASSTSSISSVSSTSSHSSDNNQYHNQEPEPLVIIPYEHTESSESSESSRSSESSESSDTSDDEYSYDDSKSADSFDRESIEDHTEFCEYSDYDSVYEGGSIGGDDGIYEDDELELDGDGKDEDEEEGYQDDDIELDEELDEDEVKEAEEHEAEEKYEHSFTTTESNPPEQQFASFTDTERFGYRAASISTSNGHRQNYSQKRNVSLNSHLIQLTLQTAEQCCS